MSISIQENEAEIPTLVGKACERLLAIQTRRDNSRVMASVFWLKIRDGAWYRFFIDCGVLQWRERDEAELERDLAYDSEFPARAISNDYQLVGHIIAKVQMTQAPVLGRFGARLTVSFLNGRMLVIEHSEDDSQVYLIEPTQPAASPHAGAGVRPGDSDDSDPRHR